MRGWGGRGSTGLKMRIFRQRVKEGETEDRKEDVLIDEARPKEHENVALGVFLSIFFLFIYFLPKYLIASYTQVHLKDPTHP